MKKLILLAVILVCNSSEAQIKIKWSTFERLQFEEVYDEESAAWLIAPIWTEDLKELDGKKVKITGYIIALDVLGDEYALSAFPFASCFFCGASGPESVMELSLDKKTKYLTDEVHTFVGILRLNDGTGIFPISLDEANSID
ncbi:MAG: DUF3299 domain-containing protein [Flavobacteriales bacterium]|jgi:hypothetical protein